MQNNLLCFGDSNMKFCVKRTLVKRKLVKRTLILIVLSMFLCNLWSVSISVDKIYPQMSKENQKLCKDVLENQMPLEAAKKILLASEQKEISKNDKILMISLASQIFEQIGSFTEAQKLYTSLSSLYPLGSKESSEELLNAVRCSLSQGDYITSEVLINSIFTKNLDEVTNAKLKLYSIWQWLCKVQSIEDLHEPLVILKSYIDLPLMQSQKPQILLTLWYITKEEQYAIKLKKIFPNSVEAAIVDNKSHLLPNPFWFFICLPATDN